MVWLFNNKAKKEAKLFQLCFFVLYSSYPLVFKFNDDTMMNKIKHGALYMSFVFGEIMINKCKMEDIRAYKEFVHWYQQKRYYTRFQEKGGLQHQAFQLGCAAGAASLAHWHDEYYTGYLGMKYIVNN